MSINLPLPTTREGKIINPYKDGPGQEAGGSIVMIVHPEKPIFYYVVEQEGVFRKTTILAEATRWPRFVAEQVREKMVKILCWDRLANNVRVIDA